MTREQAKELLPVIKAFAEGEKIQYRNLSDEWIDIKENEGLIFISNPSHYRIKPQQKYRPFENKEECWEEMQKHQPFGWVFNKSNDYLNIECVYTGYLENCYGVRLQQDKINSSFENMFKNYKFADGTPFGIKEE